MDVNGPEAKEWSDLMGRLSAKDAEIDRLNRALEAARMAFLNIERRSEEIRAQLSRIRNSGG